jgi:site-specific recombinase XerD
VKGLVHLPGGGWRLFVRVHPGKGGLKSKRWPETATKTEMREWREDVRVKARAQPKPAPSARGTLAADIDHYLKLVATMPTIKDRRRDMTRWQNVLGMRPRPKLTRDDYRLVLQEWRLTGKGGHPLAASTVNHRRTAMMHLYTTLDGKGAPNPLRDIPPFTEPPAEPRDIGIETARAILAALKPSKSRARLNVLAWTGLRGNSELGKMKPEYLNLEQQECWAPTGKKGKPRLIVLNADGVDAWQEFAHMKAWGKYSKDSLRRSFHRAVAIVNRDRLRAGLAPLRHLRVYDLRHTIATAMRRGGADLADIQAHLGHTSPRMTQRYAPFQSDKLRKVIGSLGGSYRR